MKYSLLLLVPLSFLLLFACKSNNLYEDYKTLESKGWDKDSIAHFEFNIEKNYLSYDLWFNIRNRGDYPYSNLWLFVDIVAPDQTIIKDTIEYQIAFPNGKWTGKGTSGIYSNHFTFRENVFFPVAGNYSISVRHAMRPNPLIGVSDIGLEVKKR